MGSVGNRDENALGKTINSLFKAEVIHRRGPWRNFEIVEYAALEWVDCLNNLRLPEPIKNIQQQKQRPPFTKIWKLLNVTEGCPMCNRTPDRVCRGLLE